MATFAQELVLGTFIQPGSAADNSPEPRLIFCPRSRC